MSNSESSAKDWATPKVVAEGWGYVTARDIMQSDVITVPYATPLSEVERTLSDNRISGAPVTDEAGHIIGIVSIRDLVERYAEDPDARPRRGNGFYHLSSEEMLDEDFESFEVPAESAAVDRRTTASALSRIGEPCGSLATRRTRRSSSTIAGSPAAASSPRT